MNFKKIFKTLLNVFLLTSFIIFLLILYPVLIEPNILVVKHKKLYLPNFNPAHNGLKIAVLSDFHINKYGVTMKKMKTIVKRTNREKTDYIFLLGDLDSYLIEKYNLNHSELSSIMSEFSAKYGVISVLGNHDFGPSVVKPILLNANIEVLENQKQIDNINGEKLVIYGLKDLWYFNVLPQKVIKKEDKGNSIIVLSHNPDLFPDVPSNTSLTLSGHTHGGQICLPFFGGIFTPSIWEQRFNKGYIVENNKHLYVTSGLGFSAPVRFGNPPEIVILELYSQETYPNKTIQNTKELKGLKHSLNAVGMSIARKFLDYFSLI